ncbi:MAG: Gfo/Idh/MocA family oxidoreductase [Gemmatimonadota bacterium]
MSAGPVRVGLAGAGWVTGHHLDAWGGLAGRATVVAIADPVRTAAEARAARYGIPAVFESVEEMLQETRLDALDVATPRETHVAICRMAAEQGLAILCQKPLAPTLREAEALVAELPESARLMVHENWRFRPHYRRMGEWIRAGRIGVVRGASLGVFTSGLLPDATGELPALVRQPMLAGLERMLLMEVMIHHVDTLRFLLGPLTLDGSSLGKGCAEIRGEDRATLFMSTAKGAPVTLAGDFMAHGHPPQQMDRLEILGAAGAIVLEEDGLTLHGGSRPEVMTLDLAADYAASYRATIAHFLDRLADGESFETAPADNLETLRIVEEAYRRAGRGG